MSKISRMLAGFLILFAPWVSATDTDSDLSLARVMMEKVPSIYHLDGTVEAVQGSTISAQTSGQVREVLFDVDDLVQAGSTLLVIDDTEQRAALAQAEANQAEALAKLANAEKAYQRIRSLYAKQAVSKSSMDEASSQRKAARAAVDATRAAVKQARQQLEYTRVQAPYTGIVTERFVQVGEIVTVGQRLMSGISLEELRVIVDVPQSMIEAVRSERDAAVYVDRRWVKAKRVTIFPIANSATDTFRVRLALPADLKGVYPGMYLKTALNVGEREVLTVPAKAVVFRSEVVGVYVLDPRGKVRLRHIRVGNTLLDGRYVVLSGLEENEQVATNPQEAVRRLIGQRKRHAGDED